MRAAPRAALLAACCAAVAARAAETVDWRDAAQCIGRVCSLRGTVAVSDTDGPTIRLYFDEQQRDVRVLLMRGWLVTWPAYEGRTIVATGKVDRFRDHVELIVVNPNDVQLVDAAPSPSPTPGGAPSPTPGEVERLRQRVRELEQRLRELGGP